MRISRILKEHPSLTHPEDMALITKPLKALGITYFSHAHMSPKGELATLCSDPAFLEQYYEQGFYDYDLHQNKPPLDKGYFLWDSVKRIGGTKDLYQFGIDYGVSHTFSIIEEDDNGRNVYHFATKPGNTFMNEFYLQHIDLLENFVAYFKDKLLLNDRLNRAYKVVCKTDSEGGGYLMDDFYGFHPTPASIQQFLKAIGRNKDGTNSPASKLKIPRRELQCAYYLLQGKTSKEISTFLHLSPRTVEVYFDRLKCRFGARNKIELVGIILRSDL